MVAAIDRKVSIPTSKLPPIGVLKHAFPFRFPSLTFRQIDKLLKSSFNIMKFISIALLLPGFAFGLYEHCYPGNGLTGICLTTASCHADGGTSDPANLCPGPNNVQCCTKNGCASGEGACDFVDDCRSGVSTSLHLR